ncbi:hypothetical protein ABIF95_002493 [Bradyrhizobium ottawaense]
MGPGSAAHHCVLRCVRGTRPPYPFGACFSDAVAGLALAPTTRTASPSERPSGRRGDDAVVRCYARGELDLAAEVAGDGHGLEQNLVVRTDGGDAQPVAVEDQRAGGDAERRGIALEVELHAGIAAGHQLSVRIVEPELHARGAGGDVDGLRGRLHRRLESPVRILGQRDRRLGAYLDRRHVVLGHVDIDAQLGDVGDHEHRRARAATGIDQRADIGVARGDDAVERRGDLLVAGQRFQPLDIGLARIDGRVLVREIGGALVDLLRRDEVGGDQRLAPVQRCFRQPGAGLLAGEVGSSLKQLLIEVRRLDLGDHLTGLDAGADIGAPALQIARHAGEDRGAIIGLQPARQIDGGIKRLGAGLGHRHAGNGLIVGPFLQLGALLLAGTDAGADDEARRDQRHHAEDAQFPVRHRRAGFSGRHAGSPTGRRLWRLVSCGPC